MFVPGIVTEEIDQHLFRRKAIILFGPRQVGKTTLLKKLLQEKDEEIL